MLTVKRGDRYPTYWTIREVLPNGKPGPVVDLTGAEVELHAMKGTESFTLTATVHDATGGVARHVLTGALQPGKYKVEAEIQKDGEIRTAPTIGTETLVVEKDLGGE